VSYSRIYHVADRFKPIKNQTGKRQSAADNGWSILSYRGRNMRKLFGRMVAYNTSLEDVRRK